MRKALLLLLPCLLMGQQSQSSYSQQGVNGGGTLTPVLCPPGQYTLGINTTGVSQGCTTVSNPVTLMPVYDRTVAGSPGSCKMHLLASADGHNFNKLGDGPTYTGPTSIHDPDILFLYGVYWLAYTIQSNCTGVPNNTAFELAYSPDAIHWTDYKTVTPGVSSINNWGPKWFVDPNTGSIYITLSIGQYGSGIAVYSLLATTSSGNPFASFGTPVALTTVSGSVSTIDGSLYYFGGSYKLITSDGTQIQYWSCTNPATLCTAVSSGNWAGWGANLDAPSLVIYQTNLGATAYRMYFDNNPGQGMEYSESATWPGNSGTWSAPAFVSSNATFTIRGGRAVLYPTLPINPNVIQDGFSQDTNGNLSTTTNVNGATPTAMAFLDATSSIQTQLNGKQAVVPYGTATYTVASGTAVLGTSLIASGGGCASVVQGTALFGSLSQITGAGYGGTSTTSLTVGLGPQTLTTGTGLSYAVGNVATITYASNSADYMVGTVTSYSGSTLVVNVMSVGGSGTFASWNVNSVADTIVATFTTDPTAITGYVPSINGILTIYVYPLAGSANFKVCNNTATNETPGAATLAWRASR